MEQRKIEKLIQTLLDCGYHEEQIDRIIRETAEDGATAGNLQEERIRDVLAEYVNFAVKCKKRGT